MLVGTKIRLLRKNLKLRQEDLCCDILSRTSLSKIENNKFVPDIYQLQHLSGKLNLPMNSLVDGMPLDIFDVNADITSNDDAHKLYNIRNFYELIRRYERGDFENSCDSNLFFYVGHAYFENEYFDLAHKILKKYLTAYLKFDAKKQAAFIEYFATALNDLMKIMHRNSNYDKALHYASLAKKHLEQEDKTNSYIYYSVMNNIGALFSKKGEYTRAIAVLEDFLHHNKTLTYLNILPYIHLSLNIGYYNVGEYDKSIYHIKSNIFFHEYLNQSYEAKHSHLNYINSLRYANKYEEAFHVLDEYRTKYADDTDFTTNFLIQEIILYFNIEDYIRVSFLLQKVKQYELSTLNKFSCFFIKGHICFMNKEFSSALSLLKKCEKYFISKAFFFDLTLLYFDLYAITKEEQYKVKATHYNSLKGKKNILT